MNNKEVKLARMSRVEGQMLTDTGYNFVIGLVLMWGILIDCLMASLLKRQILSMNYALVLVIYLVGSLGCMFLVYRSTNPALSFLGFTGLAACMGLLLTYYVSAYTYASVSQAFMITGMVTIVMVAAATIFPAFFRKLGGGLTIALIACIVIELIAAFIFRINLTSMDYIIVLIFSGYIGYDWTRAQAYPKTLDNAIDSAADIFVDIVNIFIRILSILGKKKN